jgi:hypothetical protein
MDKRGSFHGGKADGAWIWPLTSIQCRWSKNEWSYTSSPQYASCINYKNDLQSKYKCWHDYGNETMQTSHTISHTTQEQKTPHSCSTMTAVFGQNLNQILHWIYNKCYPGVPNLVENNLFASLFAIDWSLDAAITFSPIREPDSNSGMTKSPTSILRVHISLWRHCTHGALQ